MRRPADEGRTHSISSFNGSSRLAESSRRPLLFLAVERSYGCATSRRCAGSGRLFAAPWIHRRCALRATSRPAGLCQGDPCWGTACKPQRRQRQMRCRAVAVPGRIALAGILYSLFAPVIAENRRCKWGSGGLATSCCRQPQGEEMSQVATYVAPGCSSYFLARFVGLELTCLAWCFEPATATRRRDLVGRSTTMPHSDKEVFHEVRKSTRFDRHLPLQARVI